MPIYWARSVSIGLDCDQESFLILPITIKTYGSKSSSIYFILQYIHKSAVGVTILSLALFVADDAMLIEKMTLKCIKKMFVLTSFSSLDVHWKLHCSFPCSYVHSYLSASTSTEMLDGNCEKNVCELRWIDRCFGVYHYLVRLIQGTWARCPCKFEERELVSNAVSHLPLSSLTCAHKTVTQTYKHERFHAVSHMVFNNNRQ